MHYSVIEMIEMRFGYFPHRFKLDGKTITVKSIERTHTENAFFRFQTSCDDGHRYELTYYHAQRKWKALQLKERVQG